jgi:predicted DNA-binding transcriptional regulator YafY
LPRDLSSVRLSRLNSLVLAFYSTPRMSKREIITRLEYSSDRTFERDLAYLRDEYAVDISYNRNTSQYVFLWPGEVSCLHSIDRKRSYIYGSRP